LTSDDVEAQKGSDRDRFELLNLLEDERVGDEESVLLQISAVVEETLDVFFTTTRLGPLEFVGDMGDELSANHDGIGALSIRATELLVQLITVDAISNFSDDFEGREGRPFGWKTFLSLVPWGVS